MKKKTKKSIAIIITIIGLVATLWTLYGLYNYYRSYQEPIRVYPSEKEITCGEWGGNFEVTLENVYDKPIYGIYFMTTINSPEFETFQNYGIEPLIKGDVTESHGGFNFGKDAFILYGTNNLNWPCAQTILRKMDPGEIIEMKIAYSKEECEPEVKIKFDIASFEREEPQVSIFKDNMAGVTFTVQKCEY